MYECVCVCMRVFLCVRVCDTYPCPMPGAELASLHMLTLSELTSSHSLAPAGGGRCPEVGDIS